MAPGCCKDCTECSESRGLFKGRFASLGEFLIAPTIGQGAEAFRSSRGNSTRPHNRSGGEG